MQSLSNASDEELLSQILPITTVKEIATEYGTYGHLRQWLATACPEDMVSLPGIGPKKAKQIQAVFELMLRCQRPSKKELPPLIRSPQDASRLFLQLSYRTQEEFHVILLDTKRCVLSTCHIATGILDGALVAPREVFSKAIKQAASAVILVHNHPSGAIEPSQEDRLLTSRMVEAGKIVGIDVLDHIIVGHLGYASAKEEGWL